MDYLRVKEEQNELLNLMNKKKEELIEKKEEYDLCQAEYDNEYNLIILSEKSNNSEATIADLKAMALTKSYPLKMKVIKANSIYLRAKEDYKDLERRYETKMEDSRMARNELKHFNYGDQK